MRVQQQARRLDRIAGHRDDARLLPLQFAVAVVVEHLLRLAARVGIDPHHVRLGAQLHMSGGLRARQLGVERGPLRARAAALKAEAALEAMRAIVAHHAVDRHVPGIALLVADLHRAGRHHLEVVIGRQARQTVGARHAQLLLRAVVVRVELFARERPVEQIGVLDIAIGGPRLELVRLDAQARAGPVRGRAADRLADPCGQIRKVFGDAPAARRGAFVEPRQQLERTPLVGREVGLRMQLARLQHDDVDTLLRQFVRKRAATRARSDDHDDLVVVVRKTHLVVVLIHVLSPLYWLFSYP
jgi:hypothetical protein